MQHKKDHSVNDHKHIRLDLIDADGCIYHSDYQDALDWLFLHYGEIFAALDEQRLSAKKNKQALPIAISATLAEIKEQLQSMDLSEFTRHSSADMIGEITRRGAERINRKDGSSKQYFGQELYEEQMRYYLNALYFLDKELLQIMLARTNPELMNFLAANNDEFDLQYLGVGSNRQSYQVDLQHMSANLTGSVFSDVLYFTRELRGKQTQQKTQIALQPLTMTDLASGLPNGESFRRIITRPVGEHENYICDRSKLALLYMMSHETAKSHPEAKITINFIDNDPRILDGLFDKLHEKPGSDMLPANVKVVLQPYDGKLGVSRVIQGTGPIDYDYRENVRYMISSAHIHRSDTTLTSVDTVKDLNLNEFLANRKIKPKDKTLAVMLDADGCIYHFKYYYLVMKLLAAHGQEIKNAARKFDLPENIAALREKLMSEIKAQDLSSVTRDDFQQMIAIQNKNSALNVTDVDILEDNSEYFRSQHTTVLRQYLRYLHELDPEICAQLLYHANEEVFTHVVERARQEGCTRIVFAVGSNRQCAEADEHNCKNNGSNSFFLDLHDLVSYAAKQHTDIKMELTRFLLADVFGDLEEGEAFQRALHNPHHSPNPGALFDESKVAVVYGVVSHLLRHYPDTCAIEFYDDLPKIFAAIMHAYGEKDTHHILPRVPLDMILRNGTDLPVKPLCTITGSGKPDVDAHQSLKLMAELCGVDLRRVRHEPVSVDVDEMLDLKEFAAKLKERKSAQEVEYEALTTIHSPHLKHARNLSLFASKTMPASVTELAVNKAMQKN